MDNVKYFEYGQKEIQHLKQADPILGAAIDRIGPLKRQMMPDLFAALVRAIVGQQISTQALQTVYGRMTDDLGAITPRAILTRTRDEIQAYGLTFRKADYIRRAADKVHRGEVDLDALHTMSDDEVAAALTTLDGVGPWTAEMLMIFSMGRPDVISYGDLAIIRGMKRLYGYGKISRATFTTHREAYAPYATTASLYIWEIAADPPILSNGRDANEESSDGPDNKKGRSRDSKKAASGGLG